jgi:hypothetical protein
MSKLIQEIQEDIHFVKTHTLQPKWYKLLKIFILIGFLAGYSAWFGLPKTGVFLIVFFFLSFLVHMTYRIKTKKWKRSWLDFIVVEEGGQAKPKRIGKFYYSAVIINAVLSMVISQVIF